MTLNNAAELSALLDQAREVAHLLRASLNTDEDEAATLIDIATNKAFELFSWIGELEKLAGNEPAPVVEISSKRRKAVSK